MTTSQNGWSASPALKLRKLVVNGVDFAPGIRDDADVATVLGYVATQYAKRVEPLRNPGCWGFSYRPDKNQVTDLSNHASGTAIDINAPAHPNGVAVQKTFTPGQVSEIHKILAEVDHVVRWGGDYTKTIDAMHFEINASAAQVKAVAKKLTAKTVAAKPVTKPKATPNIDAAAKNLNAAIANRKPGPVKAALKAALAKVKVAKKAAGK